MSLFCSNLTYDVAGDFRRMPTAAPKCPWCAKPMSYVRTAARTDGAQKHRYECKRCIVHYEELHVAGDRPPERARKLDRHQVHTLQ